MAVESIPPERNAPTVTSARMCLATESRSTSATAAYAAGPVRPVSVNAGRKYRSCSISPPGRRVNEHPDSIRRTVRCSVAGSGTYCRIR